MFGFGAVALRVPRAVLGLAMMLGGPGWFVQFHPVAGAALGVPAAVGPRLKAPELAEAFVLGNEL